MAKIVIATTTFYPKGVEDIRARLAFNTIGRARAKNCLMVIVDGGSTSEVLDKFQELGAQVHAEQSHEVGQLGPGRRQALQLATQIADAQGCVVWTEPEKWPLMLWINELTRPVLNQDVEMVVPHRQGLDSYPVVQGHAEDLGNELLADITGIRMDTWFGPMVLSQAALRYFLEYQGDYGDRWDSIHIPRLRVIAAQLTWLSLSMRYEHPREQTEEEEGDPNWGWRRVTQLQNMLPAFWMEAYKLGLAKKTPPRDILERYAHLERS